MKKFAMIGYYHDYEGGVYAVGNEGVTLQEAKERAAKEGLALFQLFPLQGITEVGLPAPLAVAAWAISPTRPCAFVRCGRLCRRSAER